MFGPRLTEADLASFDDMLQRLLASLTARPAAPYDSLAVQIHGVLAWTGTRMAGPGREADVGCWDWQGEWSSLGALTWSRFGDRRVPEWKALHDVFTAMVGFVVEPRTRRQRQEYGRQLADAIGDYMELRPHGTRSSAPARPCPVELQGQGKPIRICGQEVPGLVGGIYLAVAALVADYDIGGGGVSREKLKDLSGLIDPRKDIENLRNPTRNPQSWSAWAGVLRYRAGVRGKPGVHFLRWPEPAQSDSPGTP